MKVRRRSPICAAVKTADGTAVIQYKGRPYTIRADYVLTMPDDGSKVALRDLSGFRIVQADPLLVQQIHPIEECVEIQSDGVVVNHAGHKIPAKRGDFMVGNRGSEVHRHQKDIQHYEIVEP